MARAGLYYGHLRHCPVCDNSARRFRSFGSVPREEAECPHCGALERHRLLWLYLQKNTDLLDGRTKKMLHIAPERCLESRLRKCVGDGYLTADIVKVRAMVEMDITNIQYADRTFDAIYCSHVLVYIPDDGKAMRELHRILKKDGWAILLEPINSEKTVDDPSIVETEDRFKVRKYGPDYLDRLRDAGFSVKVTKIHDLIPKDQAIRFGLSQSDDEIYYCTKN